MDIYAIASLSFFACFAKLSRPTSEIRTLSDKGLHAAVIFKKQRQPMLLVASHVSR
jgi:hypothetical protein